MMKQLEEATPWLREPTLYGCEYFIRFRFHYPYLCFALTEDNRLRQKFEDLRYYPMTDGGRDAANADLKLISDKMQRISRNKGRTETVEYLRQCSCCCFRRFPQIEAQMQLDEKYIEQRRSNLLGIIHRPNIADNAN